MLYTLKKKKGLLVKTPLTTVNAELIEEIRAQHKEYVLSGVLIGNYEDNKWVLNGQTRRARINFASKMKELQCICEARGVEYGRLVQILKVYTVLRIDTSMPPELSGHVSYFINELVRSELGTVMEEPNLREGITEYYVDFLRMIPEISENYMKVCCRVTARLKQIRKARKNDKNHPMRLNEFLTYFELDEILRGWWSENTDIDKKMYYYPFYLFWVITTILPLRVTEFCVTPLNCILEKDGLYYLTIRRTRLKGSSASSPTIRYHRISQDYTLHTYEIPRWLYEEIAQYQKLTSGYDHPYDLLFSVDAVLHLNYGYTRTGDCGKAYSSEELRESIAFFYADVLEMEKGYNIVSETDLLERSKTEDGMYEMDEHEIMMLHPKETRHLAMINLILRGANPMMIKEFAGHTNVTTSAHYYSNLSNMIRCATKHIYDRYRASKGTVDKTKYVRVNPASLNINPDDPHVQVDGGNCYSSDFMTGRISDCKKNGGNCKGCAFFIKEHSKGNGEESTDKEAEESIEDEADSIDMQMEYYIKMLNDPKLDDKIEEFQVRTLMLEESAVNLSTQLWQEFIRRSHEKEKDKA